MLSRNGQASSGDVRNYGVALSQKGVRIKSIGSMGKAKRGVVIGIRKHLWNQLHYLQPNSDIPWLLGGDFNTLLKGDERVRGSANVVGAMICNDNNRNWALFDHLLHMPVFLRLAAIKCPLPSFPLDSVGWERTSNGDFTVKSAYAVRRGIVQGPEEDVWMII
ncbi:hypothetical protein V6N12_063974 [Hibiscus sabdariffa]|uniref:Endonuclease/exonuclease/phosphatase domain-containing protein n=1 Tax=Hibiscus sabdariffa TaxID=183260 RepID=A0ABR2AQT6_9ROSI